jgi:ribose 5-phosphate isomerase B
MRIAIGCDHKGLELKQLIMQIITDAGYDIEDFGCYTADSVDYPDIAEQVAQAVAKGDFNQGILICNTGIGMSIVANKIRGIRAALCHDAFSARRARQHNDANILCLGTELEPEVIREIIEAYLTSEFEGGRHLRRLSKIKTMEGKLYGH